MGFWNNLTGKLGRKVELPKTPLKETATAEYRPSYGILPMWGMGAFGMFSLAYVDEMRTDPQVRLCLAYKQAPLFTAEFEIEAEDPRVQQFVQETLERFWRKSLAYALESYAYGYMAGEYVYKEEDGLVQFDCIRPVHPRDAKVWTHAGKIAWVRVTHVEGSGYVDLEGAQPGRPAKGFWLTYDPTYNPFYGRPALAAAWWPWRLKVMPDGAMETLFKWAYKHSISCTVVRHPDTYYDAGSGRTVSAQDIARQMCEQVKAGGVVAISSARDEKGQLLWDIEQWGKIEGQSDGLVGYIDVLDKQIQRAILIPDEVITHEGSTGGYSRSQVAASAFFLAAEQSLNHIVETVDEQMIHGLVAMNFGPTKYRIKPKPLLPPDQNQQQGGMPGMPPGAAPPDGAPPDGADQPGGPPPEGAPAGAPGEDFSQFAQLSRAWKNLQTGEVRYQDNQPGERSGTTGQWQAHTPGQGRGQQAQQPAQSGQKPPSAPAGAGDDEAQIPHEARLKVADFREHYKNHPTHQAKLEADSAGNLAMVVRDKRTGQIDREASRLIPKEKGGGTVAEVKRPKGYKEPAPEAPTDRWHGGGEAAYDVGDFKRRWTDAYVKRAAAKGIDPAVAKQKAVQVLKGTQNVTHGALVKHLNQYLPSGSQVSAHAEDDKPGSPEHAQRNPQTIAEAIGQQLTQAFTGRRRRQRDIVDAWNDPKGTLKVLIGQALQGAMEKHFAGQPEPPDQPNHARDDIADVLPADDGPDDIQDALPADQPNDPSGGGGAPAAPKPTPLKPHGHFIKGSEHYGQHESPVAAVQNLQEQMRDHVAAGGKVVLHKEDGSKVELQPDKSMGKYAHRRWVDQSGTVHGLGAMAMDKTGKQGVEFLHANAPGKPGAPAGARPVHDHPPPVAAMPSQQKKSYLQQLAGKQAERDAAGKSAPAGAERQRTAKLHELPLDKVLARIQKTADGKHVFKHTKGQQEFGSRPEAEAWVKAQHAKAVQRHGARPTQLSRHVAISLEDEQSGPFA